ncbi:MAG: limonene-1,2-epoxide hydrolase [Betaproteobacteria bacterium]|nr:MAG: limonene-1,2-epoxide hydrolase [Betaproteobacteria bacterium]
MTGNEEIVRDFINAWSRLDPAELALYFSADGTYHNMPSAPVTGRENIEKFIGGFLKNWSSTQWDILNIVSRGDVVVAERVDRTMVGAKAVDLPCCGVFEMKDRKIKLWRDYFDLATYTRSLRG